MTDFKNDFLDWVDRPIPFESVSSEAKWYQLIRYSGEYDAIVETGSAYGVTTELLAGYFKRVITIELAEELFVQAKDRLSKFDHVSILHGSSAALLPKAMKMLDCPAVYYLDGHYSGGGTAKDVSIDTPDTPIVHELLSLSVSEYPNIIVVDDARLFKGEEWHDERFTDYPSFEELAEIVSSFAVSSVIYRELDAFVIEPVDRIRSLGEK